MFNNTKVFKRTVVGLVMMCALSSYSLLGQSLRDEIQGIFDEVLKPTDEGGSLFLSGRRGVHGRHFIPSSVEASEATINSFANFVSANISSFPLSSTTAGLTFDFSTGVPVSTSTSLGPIFTERAQTLGRNRFNMGFNFSYLNLNKWRGVNTEDIRFTFVHDDFAGPDDVPPDLNPSGTIGDDPFGTEFDSIDLFMNLNFNANIFVFHASYGITNRLDIGIAVPYITVSIEANPLARMNPLTALSSADSAITGDPTHFWGADTLLQFEPTSVKDDAVGVGDIALRLKYNFLRGQAIDLAALAEYRFATGDEEDFLGAGEPSYKGHLIFSSIIGEFSPHLNVGYEHRGNQFDRDEIEVFAGYDQKISETLTLAVDFLGEFEIGEEVEELRFPESVTLQGGNEWANFTHRISLTNIPNFSDDHIINGAIGIKFVPRENFLIFGNVFVPLSEGGLRSNFVPTVGFESNF